MPVYGRRGKPTAGFPLRPQTLEIAKSAISTFPPSRRLARGKVEIQKQDFHFPNRLLFVFSNQKKGAWRRVASRPASRLILYEN